jgi:predicted transcriptional regulator
MDVSPDFTAQEASVATSIAVVALRKLGLNADIRYDDAKHCVELDR